jgi:hypothetical protein
MFFLLKKQQKQLYKNPSNPTGWGAGQPAGFPANLKK